MITIDREMIKSITTLATVIEARDPYTGGHTWRVSQYAVSLAEHVGFDTHGQFIVNLGGLVHDLGKVGIPDGILKKPDRLTDEEYLNMKQHPQIGYELVEPHTLFTLLKDAVYGHHERIDGLGYPFGRVGAELSPVSRIMAIADAFDAMTSTRPYRQGMPLEKALEILNAEKGKQFDSAYTDQFIQLAKSGKLNHILGHSGDERLLLTCPGCGPIIDAPPHLKDGDHIMCPSCHGDYVAHTDGESFEIEWTGKTETIYVPRVDLVTVDHFMKSVPQVVDPYDYVSK